MKKKAYSSLIRSEKGLALVTVLVLSLICLAIISTLLYMVIQGTRFSGYYKRYETAREAGRGGAEIGADFVVDRGLLNIPLLPMWSYSTGGGGFLRCDCGDPEDPNDNKDSSGARTCACDKICDDSADWPLACSDSLNPTDNPDLVFDLAGVNATYRVSVKIIGSVRGNSDTSGLDLGDRGAKGVVSSGAAGGEIPAPPMPYLHRIEVNAQDTGNLEERARLSALYAF